MVAYVSLESTEYSVSETGGTVSIAFFKEGDLAHEVTIEYGTNGSSATSGVDYSAVHGFVTIPAGESRAVIQIPIINDGIGEPTESFNVSLINATGGTVLFPRTALVNILDDEQPAVAVAEPPLESNFAVTFQPVVENLVEPISIEFSPTDPNIAIVALKGGVIKTVDLTTGNEIATVLDISSKVNNTSGDRGLLDIALHPDFANHPYIYVFYVVDPPDTAGQTGNAGADGVGNRFAYVSRLTVDTTGGGFVIDPNSEVVLVGGDGQSLADISGGGQLNFTEMQYAAEPSSALIPGTTEFKQDFLKMDSLSHAGGALLFGPDGALYITTGDGSSYDYADPRTVEVQSIDSLSGKVLRVDPITGLGLPDNPFVTPGADLNANSSKVYQLGLRNPFAATFDPNGRLILSETGWFSYEEIDSGGPGANFGWPYYEGGDGGHEKTPAYQNFASAAAFYQAVASGAITITAPVRAFAHLNDIPGYQVQAIVGASSVYTGSVYDEAFKNNYLFTDVVQGELFSVDVSDPRKTKYLGTAPTGFGPVHMTQGPDGYIYYADLVTGSIGRLVIEGLPGHAYDLAARPQILNGTAGEESFVVDDLSERYTLTRTEDRSGITVSRGGILDTLYGYEYVKFLDKTIAVGSVAGNSITGTAGNDFINNQSSVAGQRKTTVLADTVFAGGGNDTIYGHAGYDKLYGENGDDNLIGGIGDDQLFGGNGSDRLDAGPGNDLLDGGAGLDTLLGGDGDDIFVVDRTGGQFDRVIEAAGAGRDLVRVAESYVLPSNVENGALTGTAAAALSGNELNNVLTGNGANNVIRGLGGNDTIYAGAGDDRVYGGLGVDYLYGGLGRDTFCFDTIQEIGNGVGSRDVIGGYVPGADRIDLSVIDANLSAGGNQAFTFIGAGNFTGHAGELNYLQEPGKLIVQGDLNGDKIADFQVVILGGATSLNSGDFIL